MFESSFGCFLVFFLVPFTLQSFVLFLIPYPYFAFLFSVNGDLECDVLSALWFRFTLGLFKYFVIFFGCFSFLVMYSYLVSFLVCFGLYISSFDSWCLFLGSSLGCCCLFFYVIRFVFCCCWPFTLTLHLFLFSLLALHLDSCFCVLVRSSP